jgi:DNA-binding response OmpR family regulator
VRSKSGTRRAVRISEPENAAALQVRWSELELVVNGSRIELTRLEVRLLAALFDAAGEPVKKAVLLQRVWGLERDPQTSVLERLVGRLRQKLGPEQAGEGISVSALTNPCAEPVRRSRVLTNL